MRLQKEQIQDIQGEDIAFHEERFDALSNFLSKKEINIDAITDLLAGFQVAIPSWALGAGGTRFGRFSFQGEPSNLEQKIEDVGLVHTLTRSAGAISLHIPWDVPDDYGAIKEKASSLGIIFDAVNSNTFQDHKKDKYSYKFGSLSHYDQAVRDQAVQHNIDVIEIGKKLGSKSLTVWLADGTAFPGQKNFQTSFLNTGESLKQIYRAMPEDWKLFIEYKPYEPNFYSMVIQDWGTSYLLATECGQNAYTLVDLGHHLPNTNIEQIVSLLMLKGKLGGFHFNDSKYGDDDLTTGSIKPYALFLIFNELVHGMRNNQGNPPMSWMIDASHTIKDPLEDLIQSLEAILEAYVKALLIDQEALRAAQEENDVVKCQEILQEAYRTDVRPLLERYRLKNGGALHPIKAYRALKIRENLVKERGVNTVATGL